MNGRHSKRRRLGEESRPIKRVRAARQTPTRVKVASLDHPVLGFVVVKVCVWWESVFGIGEAVIAAVTM